MKTAIEEYIEDLKTGACKGEDYYLETEKQQIIDAYNSGWQYGFLSGGEKIHPETKNSEQFFNETFNTTNKETLK